MLPTGLVWVLFSAGRLPIGRNVTQKGFLVFGWVFFFHFTPEFNHLWCCFCQISYFSSLFFRFLKYKCNILPNVQISSGCFKTPQDFFFSLMLTNYYSHRKDQKNVWKRWGWNLNLLVILSALYHHPSRKKYIAKKRIFCFLPYFLRPTFDTNSATALGETGYSVKIGRFVGRRVGFKRLKLLWRLI